MSMELRDYFRKRGWSLIILVVLPLIAAVAAYMVLHKRPQQYAATVQVAVPAIYADSDSRIGLYIADFGQALTDTDLQAKIHTATGVSTDDLSSLSAARVNLSSQLEVDLTSSASRAATKAAAVSATKMARLSLANQGLDVAQAAVAQAQQAQDKAQAALTDFQNSIGTLFPSDTYNAIQANIRMLQNSRVEALAANNPGRATALAAQVKDLQGQLTTLTPQVRQAQVLTSNITAAGVTLRSAQQALTDKQNLAATAEDAIPDGAVTSNPVSRTLPILEGVAVAMAVALLLGLAILLVPDLLRRPERRRGAVAAADDEASGHDTATSHDEPSVRSYSPSDAAAREGTSRAGSVRNAAPHDADYVVAHD